MRQDTHWAEEKRTGFFLPTISPHKFCTAMEFIPPPRKRKKTKNCSYTRDERKAIEPYKSEYRSHATRELRAQTFRTKILPAIYNYWRGIGNEPSTEEESADRIKVFTNLLEYLIIRFICKFTVTQVLACKQLETHSYARSCS